MSIPSQSRPLVPFNHHVRIERLEAGAGSGRTRIGNFPELTNHFGTVHGGALFTVGEVASAGAMFSALGPHASHFFAVTKTATIQYLKAAKGEISASAVLVTPIEEVFEAVQQCGRTTANIEVTLQDVHGVTVAAMKLEWHVRRLLPR